VNITKLCPTIFIALSQDLRESGSQDCFATKKYPVQEKLQVVDG